MSKIASLTLLGVTAYFNACPKRKGVPISIIIPAYNEAHVIEECIRSLSKQSIVQDCELILLDDDSKDNTYFKMHDLFHKYLDTFADVLVVEGKTNRGPGYRRNQGASLAKGKILIFVDADMTFTKTYVEDLTRPITSKKYKGTCHDTELVKNKHNWLARAWSINRTPNPPEYTGVFRAIKKTLFKKSGGFNPELGYFDDALPNAGLAKVVPATCYHNNPESVREIIKHSMWVGKSLAKNEPTTLYIVPAILFLPLTALLFLGLSVKRIWTRRDELKSYPELIITIPIVLALRLIGGTLGALK